jgi:hypothetical protein
VIDIGRLIVTNQYTLSDNDLLDSLQHAAFRYFLSAYNPSNGLVADRSMIGSPCSIAVVGFALSSYPVAVEHNWMTRDAAVERTLVTLRFFLNSPQSDTPDATGFKGFYYHFLHMQSGRRVRQCELSPIDTALLLAGILTAGAYFTNSTVSETEIRALADTLYRRVDWRWAQNSRPTLSQGWTPESGFLQYCWEGYSEASILYVLAMASPTHPIPANSYSAWTATYQWANLYGHTFLYGGPLFIHQFSHAWIDFRSIQDKFMREKSSDYFKNSRQATYIQREYALRNPHSFRCYGENFWGFSASDGPESQQIKIDGRNRRFFGYIARGVPDGPDDGTIAPSATLASIAFAPEISLAAIRNFCERYSAVMDEYRLPSGFNLTLVRDGSRYWISEGYFGLDQGIVVLMIENYRSQLIWKLMRRCSYIGAGLRKADFRGGWL